MSKVNKPMDFTPLVSIIIPVYNGSNFLSQAIDSALSQSYSNIEIIVVNDGSSDGGATETIALSYGDKIKYYAKENGGVSSALNYGIKKMNGDYFSWLSHDDLYETRKIEREIESLKMTNDKDNTIVCCSDNLIDSEGNIIFHPTKTLNGTYSGCDLFDTYFTKHIIINGCTLLIPKVLFSRWGGFNNFKYIQDIECWIKFMLADVSFIFIPDKLVKMRVHAGQVTQQMPELFYTEMNELLKNIINNNLIKGHLSESNIQALLIYNYKNHNLGIYHIIEQYTKSVNVFVKWFYITYGYIFKIAQIVYSYLFKK